MAIYIYYTDTDEEVVIKHKNAKVLPSGFHIVEDFKRLKNASVADIKKELAAGKHVYHARCYGGRDDEDEMVFTGNVVWSSRDFYETSSFAGAAVSLGKVPAGTLVVNVDDD